MSRFADSSPGLHLFEGYGVEIEYMIVDRQTLDVYPIADRLLLAAEREKRSALSDEVPAEVERGAITWSNELVSHVIELKTSEPTPSIADALWAFQSNLVTAQGILEPLGGRLLPSGMHPWMDPHTETQLWPHAQSDIYDTFDRIFDCSGHGWSNLQSTHLNLPFQGDEEFGRLHAAIRVLLPLLPALAASSPIVEGVPRKTADTRLAYYRTNAARVPCVTGQVIPEAAFTRAEYEARILSPIGDALAPLDASGILEPEWVNARGAIARFVRDSIEIRVLDTQERPAADLAIIAQMVAVLQALCDERWASLSRLQGWSHERLSRIYGDTVASAENAIIEDRAYLELFGVHASAMRAGDVWQFLNNFLPLGEPVLSRALEVILERGTLATRLLEAADGDNNRERLREVYSALADCLKRGRAFLPEDTF